MAKRTELRFMLGYLNLVKLMRFENITINQVILFYAVILLARLEGISF